MINTDDMFEPIKRAIREFEDAHNEQSRRIRELETALSKASLFENDIRSVLARAKCPWCDAVPGQEHSSRCSIGIVLRCRY